MIFYFIKKYMSNKKYIEKINKMYKKFFAKCEKKQNDKGMCNQTCRMSSCTNGYKYNYASVFSDGYFNKNNKLKILIVGKESLAIRYSSTRIYKYDSNIKINQHWWGTMLTIIKLYLDLPNKYFDVIDNILNKKLAYEVFSKCQFAFTDYYKCAFSEKGSWSGLNHKNMTSNCFHLLIEEIKIFAPNVIVLQDPNILTDNNIFKKLKTSKKKKTKQIDFSKIKLGYINVNGEKVYVITSYFPSNRFKLWGKTKKELYNMIDYYKKTYVKKQ